MKQQYSVCHVVPKHNQKFTPAALAEALHSPGDWWPTWIWRDAASRILSIDAAVFLDLLMPYSQRRAMKKRDRCWDPPKFDVCVFGLVSVRDKCRKIMQSDGKRVICAHWKRVICAHCKRVIRAQRNRVIRAHRAVIRAHWCWVPAI